MDWPTHFCPYLRLTSEKYVRYIAQINYVFSAFAEHHYITYMYIEEDKLVKLSGGTFVAADVSTASAAILKANLD